MNPLEEARALLPAWVPLVNLGWIPLAFFMSLIATWLGTAIALWPLRRYRGDSWVERARRFYPGRLVSIFCFAAFPIPMGYMAFLFASPIGYVSAEILGLLTGLAAYAGYLVIHIRMERRWRPMPLGWGYWLRGILVNWLVFLPTIAVLVGVAVLLPATLNVEAMVILALGAILFGFFMVGGGLYIARRVGLVRPASERLQAIVDRAAVRAGVAPRATYELRVPVINAWAFPLVRRLAFTEPTLLALNDEELTAICAHELGHLTEPRGVTMIRVLSAMLIFPLAAARPVIGSFGPLTFAVMALVSLSVWVLGRRVARRMEERSDQMAQGQEDEPGLYARALEKLYQANLMPVVLAGKRHVHPHLYDRLVTAGVTPTYPRPRKPSMLWSVISFYVALGVVLGGLIGLRQVVREYRDRNSERYLLWSIAMGVFEEGPTRHVNQALVLGDLALIHWQRQNFDAAVTLYRAASEIDRESVYSPANLAIVLANNGRTEEAEQAFGMAAERARQKKLSPDELDIIAAARRAIVRSAWPVPQND
jgi:Zn-dependent protease with chaperone function